MADLENISWPSKKANLIIMQRKVDYEVLERGKLYWVYFYIFCMFSGYIWADKNGKKDFARGGIRTRVAQGTH